jgi:serine/threonine protein kinase
MATRDTATETLRSELSRDRTLPRGSSGNCLLEDEVIDFAGGRVLDPLERARMDAHVDACDICFQLVEHWLRETGSGVQLSSSFESPACVTTFRRGSVVGGRYRIERFVARGGMGEVYEATDMMLGETVALKTVVSSAADSPRAARKLFDEVQLARRIQHPNVCRIHDLHAHEGTRAPKEIVHFLTMEFIRGERLGDDVRRRGPFPLARAVSVARQILLGLQAAHTAHVLHLDLKTDNVMLRRDTSEPEAVIMDFGLSRAFDSEARLRTSEQGQIVGSLAYMAPEQIECSPTLGKEADIYAFGVVLFELLTGQLPFQAESALAMLRKRLNERPSAPSRARPGLSSTLDGFVLKCLNHDPSSRYPDVESALAALDIAVAPGSGAPRRRRATWIGALSIAALGLAAAGWQVQQKKAKPGAANTESVSPSLPQPRPPPAASEAPRGESRGIEQDLPSANVSVPEKKKAAAPRSKIEKNAPENAPPPPAPAKPTLPGAPDQLSW